ncbi:DNA polymerase III PolC-type-like [Gymnodraco acuticeps]|uniref:exodeoxyribonuclease III n=1 Tax=Gymnodraco acuticeps TaxID=8218 RepID=A0A6P8W1C7_GYMAC|nr:DNA polymerase III PolC-type-like [Gymnodraco acuticeps]XP_034091963.1 DNA polymerase III PolC-type-like [Gymnodraco acuticeps]
MARQSTIVFFELETTGLGTKSCHIVQLAASCKNSIFNRYILPCIPIEHGATEVNDLTVSYGQLFLHGEPVRTVSLYHSLKSFIHYLGRFPGPVLLAAHYAWGFDQIVLMRVLRKFFLFEQFKKVVSGFVDTFPLSKKLYPQLDCFKLPCLVRYFLGGKYNAHAVEKAEQLEELFCNRWNPDNYVISTVWGARNQPTQIMSETEPPL